MADTSLQGRQRQRRGIAGSGAEAATRWPKGVLEAFFDAGLRVTQGYGRGDLQGYRGTLGIPVADVPRFVCFRRCLADSDQTSPGTDPGRTQRQHDNLSSKARVGDSANSNLEDGSGKGERYEKISFCNDGNYTVCSNGQRMFRIRRTEGYPADTKAAVETTASGQRKRGHEERDGCGGK